jgi:hypothetical protein
VAVSEEIIASLVEAVAALNQRTNDAASRTLIAGPQGEAGPKGERGDDAPPITDEQIKSAAVAWLQDNITQPKDGIDGKDGKDGERGPEGRPPTDEEIQLAVNIWFEINRASLVGPAGSDGRDGADGRDGSDGRNGRDGAAGATGPAGVGIALVEQRDETSFWITLTDGQEFQIELPVAKAKPISTFRGGFAKPVYLSAVDLQTQTHAANTATAMEFDTVIESYGITIEDNVRVVFSESGLYNIQFSAQLLNSDSQEHDVSIWLARDGVAEPDSCTDITVPKKHGSYNGAAVAAWNFYYRAEKNEYFRLIWSAPSALVYIAGLPARTAPVRPVTPSIILTVNKVSP